MEVFSIQTHLSDPAETDRFGAACAAIARAGDCFLLSGSVGAGKSAFARAFIRALFGSETEVPSPTYTLVQTYEADVDIWHADLYRLTDTQDVVELGLTDAFDCSICLVEWPDLLGDLVPERALHLTFTVSGDGRDVEITGDASWKARLDAVIGTHHA